MPRFFRAGSMPKTTQMKRATAFVAAMAAVWCTSSNTSFTTLQLRGSLAVDEQTGVRPGLAGGEGGEIIMAHDLPAGAVLQLGDGYPGLSGGRVGQGPPWATCFADVEVKSVHTDGETASSYVLEQWVMRGERQNTDAFKAWRDNMADGPVNVRCSPTALKDIEDVVCLECVSAGSVSFTPDQRMVSSAMVEADLQQCMKKSFDGTGFCKSASLVM
eukprot:TRINITY_DN2645_c0_g1_i1.p1 TRINITY_DN2645_c0_g1~~TRINITY_DN2645_c0_g1_i1.p1  ORF type:complete len:216 (-),score=40.43 TRINITY_DN2645_c0_g1_i1:463-1110(-)